MYQSVVKFRQNTRRPHSPPPRPGGMFDSLRKDTLKSLRATRLPPFLWRVQLAHSQAQLDKQGNLKARLYGYEPSTLYELRASLTRHLKWGHSRAESYFISTFSDYDVALTWVNTYVRRQPDDGEEQTTIFRIRTADLDNTTVFKVDRVLARLQIEGFEDRDMSNEFVILGRIPARAIELSGRTSSVDLPTRSGSWDNGRGGCSRIRVRGSSLSNALDVMKRKPSTSGETTMKSVRNSVASGMIGDGRSEVLVAGVPVMMEAVLKRQQKEQSECEGMFEWMPEVLEMMAAAYSSSEDEDTNETAQKSVRPDGDDGAEEDFVVVVEKVEEGAVVVVVNDVMIAEGESAALTVAEEADEAVELDEGWGLASDVIEAFLSTERTDDSRTIEQQAGAGGEPGESRRKSKGSRGGGSAAAQCTEEQLRVALEEPPWAKNDGLIAGVQPVGPQDEERQPNGRNSARVDSMLHQHSVDMEAKKNQLRSWYNFGDDEDDVDGDADDERPTAAPPSSSSSPST